MQPDINPGVTGSTLAQIQQLWAKLDPSDREEHLRWTTHHCLNCGRENRPNYRLFRGLAAFRCETCMDAWVKEAQEETAELDRQEREELERMKGPQSQE